MVRWQVELLGHEFDLMDLPRTFPNLPVRVIEGEGHFYLEAEQLEALEDHGEVRTEAEKLLSHINGAMRLQSPDYRNVRVGPIHRLAPDGGRNTAMVVATDAVLVRVKAMPTTVVGGVPTPPREEPAVRSLDVANRDEDAAEALDLWANEAHNWVNLYKVFEIIESSLSGLPSGVASAKEISRFTHTANHQKGAGREARHARLPTDPPKDPMALADADRLVGHLLRAWLDSLK